MVSLAMAAVCGGAPAHGNGVRTMLPARTSAATAWPDHLRTTGHLRTTDLLFIFLFLFTLTGGTSVILKLLKLRVRTRLPART